MAPGAVSAEGARGPGAQWKLQSLEFALDRLLKPVETLTLRSASVLGREVLRDAAVDVRFEGGAFLMPRLRLSALGGRVIGRMAGWRSGEDYRLSLAGEFSGLDVRGLLPGDLRDFSRSTSLTALSTSKGGDSTMSGAIQAEAALRAPQAAGRSGGLIKEISGRLEVTHVGPEALNRALMVVDPEAQNPNVVDIRRRLALASPSRAIFDLKRGYLGIDVELTGLLGQLAGSYSVPRFSVAGALGSGAVGRYLSGLAGLMSAAQPALEALGAKSIVVKEGAAGVEFRRE
jgi:hypothetical protein